MAYIKKQQPKKKSSTMMKNKGANVRMMRKGMVNSIKKSKKKK